MKNSKTLKAIALSLGLAALMAPATLNAQINRGLLQNPYKTESNKNHGMMNSQGDRRGGIGIEATTQDFGQPAPAPLGSGIAILIGAGLGYVALKKKEDEQ